VEIDGRSAGELARIRRAISRSPEILASTELHRFCNDIEFAQQVSTDVALRTALLTSHDLVRSFPTSSKRWEKQSKMLSRLLPAKSRRVVRSFVRGNVRAFRASAGRGRGSLRWWVLLPVRVVLYLTGAHRFRVRGRTPEEETAQ
jgi:hypothetical protein